MVAMILVRRAMWHHGTDIVLVPVQRDEVHTPNPQLLGSPLVELIFVRHGRPEHVETTDGTPADPPLSEVGHAQAAAVAMWLAEERIDAIYSSPMQRARQTSQPRPDQPRQTARAPRRRDRTR